MRSESICVDNLHQSVHELWRGRVRFNLRQGPCTPVLLTLAFAGTGSDVPEQTPSAALRQPALASYNSVQQQVCIIMRQCREALEYLASNS